MSYITLVVLFCTVGIFHARTDINCSLEFDDSLDMQQQLQGQELIVPFDIDPPFAYKNADGKFVGFSYDVLQEIASRGNFSVSVVSVDQTADNQTNDKVLDNVISDYDFIGSYWTDTPTRRAKRVMLSNHYVDVTRYLVTLPDKEKPPTVLDGMFAFLRPFSSPLWVVIAFGIVFSGFVSYAFEMSTICGRHHVLVEALGAAGEDKNIHRQRWKVYWGFLHRSFSHFTMAGDSLEALSIMGQVHNVVWAFVVMVLLAAYTANLASTLVVKKPSLIEYPDLPAILSYGQIVCASKSDSIIASLISHDPELVGLQIYDPPHNASKSRDNELAEAVLEGKCVGAILRASSYQILRTNVVFCNLTQRAQVGPTLGGGFAFPIERCGTYYLAIINSIMASMRADHTYETLWANQIKQVECPAKPAPVVVVKATGMGLDSFSGLFILYLCWIGCMVGLRMGRQSVSGMHNATKKIQGRRSQANVLGSDSTASMQSETEFLNDDSLEAKVLNVEFTLTQITAALRDLKGTPGLYITSSESPSPQTHRRVESKQGAPTLDTRKAKLSLPPPISPQRLTLSNSEPKRQSEIKSVPEFVECLSQDESTTLSPQSQPTSTEPSQNLPVVIPVKISEPTKRLSQNLPAQAHETQTPSKRLSQNVPVPVSEQTPEPTKRLSQNVSAATSVQSPDLAKRLSQNVPLPVAAQPSVSVPMAKQSPEPAKRLSQNAVPVATLNPEPAKRMSQNAVPVATESHEPVKRLSQNAVQIQETQTPEPTQVLSQNVPQLDEIVIEPVPKVAHLSETKSESFLNSKGVNLFPLDIVTPEISEQKPSPRQLNQTVFALFGPPSPRILNRSGSALSLAQESQPNIGSNLLASRPTTEQAAPASEAAVMQAQAALATQTAPVTEAAVLTTQAARQTEPATQAMSPNQAESSPIAVEQTTTHD